MAVDVESDWDGQDQSEIFDEDNQTLDGGGEVRTFEDLPDVLDVTHAVGDDDDDDALIAEELDDDEIIQLESDSEMADFEDDDLAGRMPEELDDDVPDEMDAAGVYLSQEAPLDRSDETDAEPDEIELEFTGDLENLPADEDDNTASLEASDLADDDLEDLGYPGEDEPAQHSEAAEAQRRR